MESKHCDYETALNFDFSSPYDSIEDEIIDPFYQNEAFNQFRPAVDNIYYSKCNLANQKCKKLDFPCDDTAVAEESTRLCFEATFPVTNNLRPYEESKVPEVLDIEGPVRIPADIDDLWEFLMRDEEPEPTKKIHVSEIESKITVQKTIEKTNKNALKQKEKELAKRKDSIHTNETEKETDSTSADHKSKTPSICKNLKGSVATGFGQQLTYSDFLEVLKLVVIKKANENPEILENSSIEQLISQVKSYITNEVRGKAMRDNGKKTVETYKVGTNDDIKRVLYPARGETDDLTWFLAEVTRTLLIDHFIKSEFYNRWVNLNLDIKDRDILLSEVDQVRKVFAEPGYRFKLKKSQK